MATLQELRALKETVPGIQIIETADSRSGKPIIRVHFREPSFLNPNRKVLDSKTFYPGAEGYKDAIKHFNFLKNKHKDTIARFGEVTGATITQKYSEDKLKFTDELIEEIDRLTKDPKNKTIKQVESKLFKAFNIPKYTVAARVDPRNAFFQPDKKFFSIPRDYELYGAPYGKKKISEQQTALRQLIGTKFFANNPNYKKTAALLTAFYTNPDSKFTKKENDTMRKFVKDFSITRSFKSGDKSIPARFFKQLNFDFGRKLKDFGKIFNITEYLQEQIKNPRISSADKNFYQKELNSFLSNRKKLLAPLAKKYPNLFGYKTSPTGNLQFEHRVARSLGEIGGVKLPKDYIARGSYVPGRFNQAKYYAYDEPLMKLVSEYNLATKSEKPNVRLKIENLTKDFNKRSGGFLENVGFDFKDKVKITDKSPLVSKLTKTDVVYDIDKTIKQSNKYFQSFGDERLKGLPKGSAASDFILGGKEYESFTKLVKDIRTNALAGGEVCKIVQPKQSGGPVVSCVDAVDDALKKNPKKLAQDINKSNAGGAFNKIKNSSTKFLTALKENPNILRGSLGSKIALGLGTVAAGAGAGALVKQFRNDDPSTYLTNDSQMEGMIISDVEQKGKEVDDNILLDNQFKLEAAAAAGLTTPIAGQVYRTAREGTPPLLESPLEFDNEIKTLKRTIRQITHPGGKKAKRISAAGQEVIRNSKIRINYLQDAFETAKIGKEGKGVFRSAFGLGEGVLGKGLWALGAPIIQLPATAGYIAQDIREGKDVGEIATNPLNYLGAAFMSPAVKALGKAGMSRGLLGIASLGLAGTAALPALSIGAGLATLGTLGYQGYKLFTGRDRSDEDFFK